MDELGEDDQLTFDDAVCPRCGYAQAGEVASWVEACPLEGMCVECGLHFVWSEVLRPDLYAPRWSVEFAAPRNLFPLRRILRTLGRSAWPWWFWRSMRMTHMISPLHIGAYVVALLLALLIVATAFQATVSVGAWDAVARKVVADAANDKSMIDAEIVKNQEWLDLYAEEERLYGANSLSQAEVDKLKARQAELNAYSTNPRGVVNHTLLDALLEALFDPLSIRSSGTIKTPFRVDPYPSPMEIHAVAFGNAQGVTTTFRHRIESATKGLILGCVALFLMPAAFVVLPVSCRIAKVKPEHLWRISAYGTLIPIALLALVLLLAALAAVADTVLFDFALTLAALGAVPLAIVWWAAAIRNYLKMPHAWSMAILLTIMNLLVFTFMSRTCAYGTIFDVFDEVLPWLI